MAKEKSEKPEKKEKKEKRSEKDGVHKSKKDKKAKKENVVVDTAALVEAADRNDTEDIEMVVDVKPTAAPIAALVPFANPLADEKTGKKVLKGVKKAAKSKTLKRGVKEVVKHLRKSPTSQTANDTPTGVVVLAADISPMDVISHIPVLCEDHGVPYVYITSRAELGAAGATKRPTSVVMIGKDVGKNGEAEDWTETYADLVKVVRKAGRGVRV